MKWIGKHRGAFIVMLGLLFSGSCLAKKWILHNGTPHDLWVRIETSLAGAPKPRKLLKPGDTKTFEITGFYKDACLKDINIRRRGGYWKNAKHKVRYVSFPGLNQMFWSNLKSDPCGGGSGNIVINKKGQWVVVGHARKYKDDPATFEARKHGGF